MELKQTFPLIFFKLFLSLVPPCPHFVLYFLKRAKLTTCCDVSFFAVVVHCLLFCPPHLLCLFSCFLTFRPLKQNRKSLFSFPFSCIIKSLSPALFFSLSTFFFFDLSPISPALFYCLISWQLQRYSSERARWNPESTVTFVSHWGHYQWQAISCNAF